MKRFGGAVLLLFLLAGPAWAQVKDNGGGMTPSASNAVQPTARLNLLPTPTNNDCLVGNGTDWVASGCSGVAGMDTAASNATSIALNNLVSPSTVDPTTTIAGRNSAGAVVGSNTANTIYGAGCGALFTGSAAAGNHAITCNGNNSGGTVTTASDIIAYGASSMYATDLVVTEANFTGTIASSKLTPTSITGTIVVGLVLEAAGVPDGTWIDVDNGDGTFHLANLYSLTISDVASPEAMTAAIWTIGSSNAGIGVHTLTHLTAGKFNTAGGTFSMVGCGNFFGVGACPLWGIGNSGWGYKSLENIAGAASENTGIGYLAGAALSTGSENIFIGSFTGNSTGDAAPITGNLNIMIGRDLILPTGATSNYLNIGNVITATGLTEDGGATNGQVTITGNLGLTGVVNSGTWQAHSVAPAFGGTGSDATTAVIAATGSRSLEAETFNGTHMLDILSSADTPTAWFALNAGPAGTARLTAAGPSATTVAINATASTPGPINIGIENGDTVGLGKTNATPPIAQTTATALNQVSGGSTALAFASTSGIAAGQIVLATSVPIGARASSIVSTAQKTQAANGSFLISQKVIPMNPTAGFAVGQQCTDTTTAAIGDGNLIASIQANVSITLTSNTLSASSGATDSITCDPVVTLSIASTATISSGASINFLAHNNVISGLSAIYDEGDLSVGGDIYFGGGGFASRVNNASITALNAAGFTMLQIQGTAGSQTAFVNTLSGPGATAQIFASGSSGATGTLQVGLAGQNVSLPGPLLNPGITTDAAHTDASVCEDTTTHQFYFGSGTLGVCLGTSSLRFKHAVRDMGDGLWAVMQLHPINFFYKSGYGDMGAREQYGFAAEEVADVLPRLVHRDAEGRPNSVDILGMIPVTIEAVKMLVLWCLALTAAFLFLLLLHVRWRRPQGDLA